MKPLSDSESKLFSINEVNALTPPPQSPSNFAMARIAPGNRTGTGGEDLLSNNFNWNLPLVSLAGRGLDLGLTLSYNSLVWVRSGNYIDFDVDDGSIAPGFRLGFPTVEGPYWNDQASAYFYLLVTPAGGRVELRYTGSGNIYESKDSAHLQLIDYGSSLLVRPTDGTQLNFISVSSSWRCNQVKDRNGNFLTINYNGGADIANITDTLGRVLTFNYDSNGNVISITQLWNGQTHYWATFGWGLVPVGNNFPSLTSYGPDGTNVTVLTQVGLPDGSRYNFDYTNTYGMVSTIHYYGADHNPPAVVHERRFTTYVVSGNGTDCPRLTERQDWAENWNGLNGVPSAYVATQFAHDPDGACRMTAPDGTTYKEYYGTGWQNGLTTISEVWSAGVRKKWTTTTWTQDNTAVNYLTNPRITATMVEDELQNHRLTTVDYGPPNYVQYSLPYIVREYEANTTTILRDTYYDYELSQPYLDAHIIGLVKWLHVVDLSGFQSKTTYGFDESPLQNTPLPTIQHDAINTARGNVTSVSRWDTTDMNTIIDQTKALTSRVGYDTNGSVVWSKDPLPLEHQTSISYADSFSSSSNLALNKPATQSSDPGWGGPASKAVDGNTSGNWPDGSVTHTNYEGQPWWQVDLGSMQSIQTVRVWNRTDCCGERLSNFTVYLLNDTGGVVASVNNPGQAGSPTTVQLSGTARYVKIQLAGTDYLSLAEVEVWGFGSTYAYPTQVTDADGFSSTTQYNYDFGAVTRTQTPLPNVITNQPGPVQTFDYDSVGRLEWIHNQANGAWRYINYPPRGDAVLSQVTLNAETNAYWTVTGFDGLNRLFHQGGDHPGSTGGFAGTMTRYDSMGRVSKQSNPTECNAWWTPVGDDVAGWQYNNPTEYDWKGRPLKVYNTDGTYKETSYGGCGCAGGEVVTLTDEVGRQQKIYSDVLGRQRKTEVLSWPDQNGNRSVYSTTTNTFNARDQVTLIRQWTGAENGGAYQDTTFSYDGYGRLKTKHLPEQNAGTATVYAYNSDDTIQSVTDARGVSATYSYNARHLVTAINYSAPAGITPTANITFSYDAVGNRTLMTDGTGEKNYTYDQLSRMTSESRSFTGPGSPPGSWALNYEYNLAGQVKSITDPFGTQVSYSLDSSGRVGGVTSSGGGSSLLSMSNFRYRAWGAIRDIDYGNSVHDHTDYNSRMFPTAFSVSNVQKGQPYIPYHTVTSTFDYYADGHINHAYDFDDHYWDRSYSFDHAARLSQANTNHAARGEPAQPPYDPYQQTVSYDAWNNSNRDGGVYGLGGGPSGTYVNNRRQDWGYDAAGNVVSNQEKTHSYDAAGHQVYSTDCCVGDNTPGFPVQPELEITQTYDGDGRPVKRLQIMRRNVYDQNNAIVEIEVDTQTQFMLNSSVLGGAVINELWHDWSNQWAKFEGYVYLNGRKVATQRYGTYRNHNPVTGSWLEVTTNRYFSREERDPSGGEVPVYPPPQPSYVSSKFGEQTYTDGGDAFDINGGCELDGMPASCSELARHADAGAVALEYLFHDGNSWRVEQAPIVSHGLGIFESESPYLRRNDEWREGDPLYDVHWRTFAFSFAGSEPQNSLPKLSTDQISELRTGISGLSDECNKFLNSLFKQLGHSYKKTILDVFKAVAKKGGFYDSSSTNSSVPGYTAVGADSRTPRIELDVSGISSVSGSNAEALLFAVVHELVHANEKGGGKYTHTQMAVAANAVAKSMGLRTDFLKGPQDFPWFGSAQEQATVDQYNSGIFDDRLAHFCFPNVKK
jgi:YD repeat-containing protein